MFCFCNRGVFEVCVSSAIAPPIIPLLVDWLQVPVIAGGPFVGDCPLAEKCHVRGLHDDSRLRGVFEEVGALSRWEGGAR